MKETIDIDELFDTINELAQEMENEIDSASDCTDIDDVRKSTSVHDEAMEEKMIDDLNLNNFEINEAIDVASNIKTSASRLNFAGYGFTCYVRSLIFQKNIFNLTIIIVVSNIYISFICLCSGCLKDFRDVSDSGGGSHQGSL